MLSGVKFVPREQLAEKRRRRNDDDSSSDSHTSDDDTTKHEKKDKHKHRHKHKHKHKHNKRKNDKEKRKSHGKSAYDSGSGSASDSASDKVDDGIELRDRGRQEAGLTWMLEWGRVLQKASRSAAGQPEGSERPEEVQKANPRELNPYLKDNGGGYPDEASLGQNHLLPTSVIGDGGASWRLKALKRAKEQAARDGKKLDEVVEERWGSLGLLTASVASRRAAPARAHLHAIQDRKKGAMGQSEATLPDQKGDAGEEVKHARRSYLEDVSSRHSELRKPKSYSWRKDRDHNSSEDRSLITSAISGLNKFTDDGSFMDMFTKKNDATLSTSSSNHEGECKERNSAVEREFPIDKGLNPNQLAAKAFQLRLKGRNEEADTLLKEVEAMKHVQTSNIKIANPDNRGREIEGKLSSRKREEDADVFLAKKIARNKQFSISKQADDEYDYDDDAPKRKDHRKQSNVPEMKNRISNRLLTQEQRCQFCFENSSRPKHLVISIAQLTYMALPPWQPVIQGHCCIMPMQHESSTRCVDDNVWEELRNFKKCLIKMFDKQDKGVIFLETVMGLAKQQRHCLIECIPLPHDLAKEAPLYFKKAIDEAEDEWSQHNAKKLIRTSREKGLRRCIPKDFPYFHVEFGLDEGFVHVIDDETKFKSSLGLNVIRGMLKLSEEDMYRRRRQEPLEKQRLAVAVFAEEWEPFDWTKQLS